MKNILFIIIFLFTIKAYTQEVIATTGNHYSNTNYSMSFTIGEPIITTYTTSNIIMTQGFHQTKLTDIASFIKNFYSDATISVFPNPAVNSVQINLKSDKLIQYKTNVYDISGKLIYQTALLNATQQQIEVSHWSVGTYIIQVVDDKNQALATAKIIKQ
ncbi:MAG: T9SS type A sorting domain-containing protein [Chitinophagales bacterium]|nr:T9SS type A sorting domain-containing protein [Chitinophagales bacterium]